MARADGGGANGLTLKADGSQFLDQVGYNVACQILATLRGSTATGGGSGIEAARVKLIDSTIDTTAGATQVDIDSAFQPRLRNSTCAGRSTRWDSSESWGVCALD